MIKATIRSAFRFWQFCLSGFLLKIQLELSTLVENSMRPKSFCVYNFRTQSKKNVLNCSFIAETDLFVSGPFKQIRKKRKTPDSHTIFLLENIRKTLLYSVHTMIRYYYFIMCFMCHNYCFNFSLDFCFLFY